MKRFVERAVWRLLAGTIALLAAVPQAGAWTSSSSAFGVVIRVEGEGWGLMTYGVSIREQYRRAAGVVARILGGAKPSDMPIEQPTQPLRA